MKKEECCNNIVVSHLLLSLVRAFDITLTQHLSYVDLLWTFTVRYHVVDDIYILIYFAFYVTYP